MPSRLLTIVFTDIKGFTERTAQADREFVVRLLKQHDSLLKPVVEKYEGTLVKKIGDAFLLTFESPTNAVLCAVMMQEVLHEYNAAVAAAEKIEIRVAINTGEVNLVDGDVLGEPVNVASRLESITEANEVWFTEATYLAMNKQEVPNSLVGEFRLKGVPEALKVYRVVLDRESELFKALLVTQTQRIGKAPPAPVNAAATGMFPAWLFGLVIFVLIGVGGAYWWTHRVTPYLEQAQRFADAQKYEGALQQLDLALQKAPNDPLVQKRVREVLSAHIKRCLELKDIEQAKQIRETIVPKYYFLSPFHDEETAIVLAEAWDMIRKGRRRELNAFLERHATAHNQRPQTLLDIGAFYQKCGVSWPHTVSYLYEAAQLEPGLRTHPEVLKGMEYFLRQVSPDEGFPDVRTFVGTHLIDHFRPLLQEGLASDSLETRSLRWNAFRILSQRGEPVDAAKVYLAELVSAPGDLNSTLLLEAATYFQQAKASGTLTLPDTIKHPALFDRQIVATDTPFFRVMSDVFFPSIQEELEWAMYETENTRRRMNAVDILQEHGLSGLLLWQYHAANLMDRDGVLGLGITYRPVLASSVAFLATQPIPAEVEKTTRADLNAAVVAFQEEVKENIAFAKKHKYASLQHYWERIQPLLDKVTAQIAP